MPTLEEHAVEARRLLAVHGTYIAGVIATLVTLDAERAAHAQFRQEVSEAVERFRADWQHATPARDQYDCTLGRFIIAESDPLVEAVKDCGYATLDAIEPEFVADLRAALSKRGLKLVEVGK